MKKELVGIMFVAMASISIAGGLSVDRVGADPVNVNLTTEGTTDWVMLGQGGGAAGIARRDEKAGASFIGPVTVSGTPDAWSEHPSRFTWTDGLQTVSGTQVVGDWEAKPISGLARADQGLSFPVEGLAVGDYTMKVYASSYKVGYQLTASIGASSMTASTAYDKNCVCTSYSISFSIERVGESLAISFKRNDSSGDDYSTLGISAITIHSTSEPATEDVPEKKVMVFG